MAHDVLAGSRTLLAVLFGVLGLAACGSEDLGSFERRVVERDLLSDLADWKLVEPSSAGKPSFGILTPSYQARGDSGDLPALFVPLGGTVEYTLPADDAQASLLGAAGVDLSAPRLLPADVPGMRVRFVVRIDGAPVFDEVVRFTPTAPGRRPSKNPTQWRRFGPEGAGFEVVGGQRISLHTELVGNLRFPAQELLIGFGGLKTVRRVPTARTSSSPERPNIVFVVMDTLRADRTSAFGYGRPTTPHLEALGARGLAYDNARAPSPWTWPSTATLFTGLEPLDHGVLDHESSYLDHLLPTLAEVLQERGFTTAAFSSNPLIVPEKGFGAGFERFEFSRDFVPGEEAMPAALQWVRENSGQRFFLYLHLVDPHDPHIPLPAELDRLGLSRPADFPEHGYTKIGGRLRKKWVEVEPGTYDHTNFVSETEAAWISDAYDASVATGDHWLGELLGLLNELDLDESTIVAFTSDHGEELFEHGLTNHAHTLHPELLHVPLVLAGPGIAPGTRSGVPVSIRHLAPTLARFGGAELTTPGALDLAAPDSIEARELLFHTRKGIWNDWAMVEIFGLAQDPWSLHWAPAGLPYRTKGDVDPGLGQWRLYDHRTDPSETLDLAPEFPERVEDMRQRITELRDARQGRGRGFGLGAGTRRMLEGVGYVETPDEDDEQ